MQKRILTSKEARAGIYAGVKKVSDAVVSTLGPMGRNAIISRCFPSQTGMQYYMPFVTKDGVTVSRNITLDDQIENTGANLIKQAAEKTMLDAGDGTTTTCLLMKVILEKGIELVDAGANPQELKKGIDAAVKYVVEELKKMAVPIDGDIEKIRAVATVSANNDSVIGDLIAEAFSKIGSDGVIDIEESKSEKTEIIISDGIKIKRGWESQYFITDKAKMECVLIDPYILLYDKKISTMAQFENVLMPLIEGGKSLLIVCSESDGEALAALAMNANNGTFRSCIIKCPEFGDKQREAMEDLAAITGATYISDEKGRALKSITDKDFGHAKKIIIGKNETSIITPKGNKKQLTELLNNLKMDLTKAGTEEKEQIEKRIAKLSGSVAVLSVGAATEVEMREKKDRCDDAVRATKAAISEGFTGGGGLSFFNISLFQGLLDKMNENESYIKGFILVIDTLKEPMKQICNNAGIDPQIKIDLMLDNRHNFNVGYNAKTNTVEDLIEAGIIDPVKVLRCSLENAASAAGMILTSETLIVDTL